MHPAIPIIDTQRAGLLVIDIQEKLVEVMFEKDRLIKGAVTLIKGFQALERPDKWMQRSTE